MTKTKIGSESHNEENLKRAIGAVILQAQQAGLRSFVFGFKNAENGQVTMHYEAIPLGEAVNICGFGWMQAIRSELAAHPEYKPDYQQIFKDALEDFAKLTLKVNQRVAAYQAASKPAQKKR